MRAHLALPHHRQDQSETEGGRGGERVRVRESSSRAASSPPRHPTSLSFALYAWAKRFGAPGRFGAGKREFFIGNLLVRIHLIIVMIWWTGLAPWELEFPFPGSLTSTFLETGDVFVARF